MIFETTYMVIYKKISLKKIFRSRIVWTTQRGSFFFSKRVNFSSVSLTFVNPSLTWMLCFHIWLQNKEKFLVWSEYYNQFGIHQPFRVSLLQPRQSYLCNPEAYSEPFQTCNIGEFCENSQWLKHSILDVWHGSE